MVDTEIEWINPSPSEGGWGGVGRIKPSCSVVALQQWFRWMLCEQPLHLNCNAPKLG